MNYFRKSNLSNTIKPISILVIDRFVYGLRILKKIQIQTDEDFNDNDFQGLNNQAIARFFKDKIKNSER